MIFPPNDPNNPKNYSVKPDFSDLSPERQKAARKRANRLFIVLLVSGLVLGSILSIGLVKLLNKFGLAAKPNHPPHFEQLKL